MVGSKVTVILLDRVVILQLEGSATKQTIQSRFNITKNYQKVIKNIKKDIFYTLSEGEYELSEYFKAYLLRDKRQNNVKGLRKSKAIILRIYS